MHHVAPVVRTFKLQIFAPQHDDYFSCPPLLITAKSGDLLITFAVHIRPNSGGNMSRGCTSSALFFTCSSRPKPPTSAPPTGPPKSQWTYCSHLSNISERDKAPLFLRDRYKTVASRPGILTNRSFWASQSHSVRPDFRFT
jgi:hypothetical protein